MTTEQLHPISIPGLPDGWRAVAYRKPVSKGEKTISDHGEVINCIDEINGKVLIDFPCLIIEKIQPRRIVLEETEECNVINRHGDYKDQYFDNGIIISDEKIWRVAEEEK